MFGLFKNKNNFLSPISGEIIPVEEVNDPIFSQKMMGTGFAIVPTTNAIYAPFDAEVVTVFPTAHAYGLKSKNGVEVIIHIGIDTVELKGEGFTSKVKKGDQVKAGDLIAKVDMDFLKKQGKDCTCIIVFPNKETIEIAHPHTNVEAKQDQIIKISK